MEIGTWRRGHGHGHGDTDMDMKMDMDMDMGMCMEMDIEEVNRSKLKSDRTGFRRNSVPTDFRDLEMMLMLTNKYFCVFVFSQTLFKKMQEVFTEKP
jgi:hypothetical protein